MSDYTIKQLDEIEGIDGGERLGKFKQLRQELGVEAFGISALDLVPNADQYPDHSHPNDGQEEIYTVLSGSGEIEIDGKRHPLDPGTMARVGPGTKRKLWAGPDGMRVVSIGGRPGHAYAPAPSGKPMGLPEGATPVDDHELKQGDFTIKQIDEMDAAFLGGFKRARDELGGSSFGLQVLDFPPNADAYPEHDHEHDGQEEVFIGVSGSGEITLDGETHPFRPGTIVHVAPKVKRKIVSGAGPMRVLALGGTPGKPYESIELTQVGAPDPLAQQQS